MEDNKNSELIKDIKQRIHPLLLLRSVWKNFLLIILLTIIALCWTYMAVNTMYKPQYTTKTTFVVSTREGAASAYSNLKAAQDVTMSFSELINSDVMKKRVIEDMGTGSLNGSIAANVISETNLMEMQVSASTPRQAYMITKSILNNYENLTSTVLNNVTLDILSYPTVPSSPVNSSNAIHYAKLAGIAAAIAGAALICVMTYLRDTIKSSEEVEEKLDTKLLATIAHEEKYKNLKEILRHEKKGILITSPATSLRFAESFKKLRARIDYQMRKNGFKVLMVTSILENEGKSTVAVNMALAMHKRKKNVLIIDGDLKKPSIHKILEYQGEEYSSVIDLLDGKATLSQTLLTDKSRQIGLILGRKGTNRSTELVNSRSMRELIEQARKRADVVIIDTPPMSVSPDAECLAEIADCAVLVVRQDITPARVINDAIDVLSNTKAELLGCIFNNVHKVDLNESYKFGSDSSKYSSGSKKQGYGSYARRQRSDGTEERV